MIDDEKKPTHTDREILIVSNPLTLQASTAASVALAQTGYLLNQTPRDDLIALDEESFLLQTLAYEPYTNWLQEIWVDWDQTTSIPLSGFSDRSSFSMRIQQSSFRGYDNVLRHILGSINLAQAYLPENSLDTSIYRLNLMANFLTYPWYDFNHWDHSCLYSFAWDLTACRVSTQLP